MRREKIVIVDDDCLLSKTMDMCLSKKGHDVSVFHSGVDAVKYLFEEMPGLIMLDLRLPDCDGWFIAKLLDKLEWAKKVPVIVVSVLEPDGRKLAEVKPYAYIQKPFDMGQLLQTVERSLSNEEPFASG